MCGIAALLLAEDTPPQDAKAAVLGLAGRCGIARRGPDSLEACVPAPRVALAASVLTMRSSGDARQPATDERGNALCWNGEWFQGGPAPDAADAPAVLKLLAEATASAPDAETAAARAAVALLLRTSARHSSGSVRLKKHTLPHDRRSIAPLARSPPRSARRKLYTVSITVTRTSHTYHTSIAAAAYCSALFL